VDFKINASINGYVGLMTGKGLKKICSKCGFIKGPNGYIGCDMTQLGCRDGEISES
jgi:hypothetical protein